MRNPYSRGCTMVSSLGVSCDAVRPVLVSTCALLIFRNWSLAVCRSEDAMQEGLINVSFTVADLPHRIDSYALLHSP